MVYLLCNFLAENDYVSFPVISLNFPYASMYPSDPFQMFSACKTFIKWLSESFTLFSVLPYKYLSHLFVLLPLEEQSDFQKSLLDTLGWEIVGLFGKLSTECALIK